jgi:hypothetical protein
MGPRESSNVSLAPLQGKFAFQRSFFWRWGFEAADALEREGDRVPPSPLFLLLPSYWYLQSRAREVDTLIRKPSSTFLTISRIGHF